MFFLPFSDRLRLTKVCGFVIETKQKNKKMYLLSQFPACTTIPHHPFFMFQKHRCIPPRLERHQLLSFKAQHVAMVAAYPPQVATGAAVSLCYGRPVCPLLLNSTLRSFSFKTAHFCVGGACTFTSLSGNRAQGFSINKKRQNMRRLHSWFSYEKRSI